MQKHRMVTLVIEPVVHLSFNHEDTDGVKHLTVHETYVLCDDRNQLTAYVTVPSRKKSMGRKILGWPAM